jgi:hypothetical protein
LRRAISPLIATIILLIVGLVAASIVMVSDMVGSSNEPTVYKLFFTSVYQVKPVSVDNAGWQLALLVENEGNQEDVLDKVYLNGELIEEIGIIHGDLLSSRSAVGTSIPVGGLAISPGSRVTIYIWIGSDLYTQGTQLTIELLKPGQFELRKIIVLR